MNVDEKIAVMQAHADGRKIEAWDMFGEQWELVENPPWNWQVMTYRVKPEVREWWICIADYPNEHIISTTPVDGYIRVREVIE